MAITDGIDREQYAAWKARHPEWAEYDVLEAVESGSRHGRYRTPLGMHYEADFPRHSEDVEIEHRMQVDSEVVVIGFFPDRGEIETAVSPDELPRTRIRASMPGKWIKTPGQTA